MGIGERDPKLCVPLSLLGALTARISDSAAGVRSKAAQAVAESLSSAASRSDEEGTASYYLREAATAMSFELVGALRTRAQLDDRASSRKQSIVALSAVLALSPPAALEDIEVLEERCNDPSVATRKAAADAIVGTGLLWHILLLMLNLCLASYALCSASPDRCSSTPR
jgi:HEAT repeat protein